MVIGKSRSLAFRAMEGATVFYISLQAVETVSQSLPEARWQFASLAEHNLETTIRVVSDLLIRRSDRRIAAVLLRVAGVPDDGRSREFHECSLTQSDLAELANVSRHLVNATLKAFEDHGPDQNWKWQDVCFECQSAQGIPKRGLAFASGDGTTFRQRSTRCQAQSVRRDLKYRLARCSCLGAMCPSLRVRLNVARSLQRAPAIALNQTPTAIAPPSGCPTARSPR